MDLNWKYQKCFMQYKWWVLLLGIYEQKTGVENSIAKQYRLVCNCNETCRSRSILSSCFFLVAKTGFREYFLNKSAWYKTLNLEHLHNTILHWVCWDRGNATDWRWRGSLLHDPVGAGSYDEIGWALPARICDDVHISFASFSFQFAKRFFYYSLFIDFSFNVYMYCFSNSFSYLCVIRHFLFKFDIMIILWLFLKLRQWANNSNSTTHS